MPDTPVTPTTVGNATPRLRTPTATTVTYLVGMFAATVALRSVDRHGAMIPANLVFLAVGVAASTLAERLRRGHSTSLWRKDRVPSRDGGIVIGAGVLVVALAQACTLPLWSSAMHGDERAGLWVLNAVVAATGIVVIIWTTWHARRLTARSAS